MATGFDCREGGESDEVEPEDALQTILLVSDKRLAVFTERGYGFFIEKTKKEKR